MMKFKIFLVAALLVFFTGCDDKNDKEPSTPSVMQADYSKPFKLPLNDGTELNIQKRNDGYDIDITDEQIKLVNESFESWIAKKMNKHENEIIDKFLDDIKEYLDPTPMTFNFEKSPWAQIVTVSYFEVIDNLRCSKRKDINDMLMDMALTFRGASKSKKKQMAEIIKDVFKDFAKQIAEFKSEDFAQQFGAKAE